MRLASFPSDVMHIACSRCSRSGRYRKSGLLHRYGPDMNVGRVLEHIAGDCRYRSVKRLCDDRFCGAYVVELNQEKPQISSASQILKDRKPYDWH